jgi:hypothetical protein
MLVEPLPVLIEGRDTKQYARDCEFVRCQHRYTIVIPRPRLQLELLPAANPVAEIAAQS